jgi:hypothetical protein
MPLRIVEMTTRNGILSADLSSAVSLEQGYCDITFYHLNPPLLTRLEVKAGTDAAVALDNWAADKALHKVDYSKSTISYTVMGKLNRDDILKLLQPVT